MNEPRITPTRAQAQELLATLGVGIEEGAICDPTGARWASCACEGVWVFVVDHVKEGHADIGFYCGFCNTWVGMASTMESRR